MLWLTTPVFVGIGHVVSIDIAFTLATLAVSLALLTFLEAPSQRRAIVVGLASGAALLTRHLGLVLVVVAIVVVAVQGAKRARRVALRHAAIVALVSWATVWIVVRVLASPSGGASGSRLDHLVSTGTHDAGRLVLRRCIRANRLTAGCRLRARTDSSLVDTDTYPGRR